MTTKQPVISVKQPKAEQSATSYLWYQRLDIASVYLFLLVFSIFILIPFIWPFLSAFTNKPENVSSLFRYKRALMFAILLIQIIPGTATVLPFYLIMRELHLLNSLWGVIIGMTAGSLPFMLWVMKGFIDTVPIELEEAAFLDGATQFQTLMQVVFPLTLPGIGAASILAFNGAWSAFFLPLILLSDADKFVMPLGLFRALIAYTNLDYGMLNAMALLYMLPSFLIFIFARQYLIKGTMAGAMAGQ